MKIYMRLLRKTVKTINIISPSSTYSFLLAILYISGRFIGNDIYRNLYLILFVAFISIIVFYSMMRLFPEYINKYGIKVKMIWGSSIALFIIDAFMPKSESLGFMLWTVCFPVFLLANILVFFIFVKRKVYHQH